MADYRSIYQRSIDDPEGFWSEAARDIDWYSPPKKIFDPSRRVRLDAGSSAASSTPATTPWTGTSRRAPAIARR